ncbi:MAG: lysylphosphatidylglycerol synthase transmembrane domain-containing protein [Mariprofundaceae bacterium]
MTASKGASKPVKWLWRTLITLSVLLIIFAWIGYEQFFQTLGRLQLSSLVEICTLLSVSIVIRGWRFGVVQESSVCGPRGEYIAIAMFHNAASQVMPFRSGEIAFPVLAKRFFGHQMSRSVASLLLIRFIEMLVLGTLVIVAVFFLLGESSEDKLWVMTATAGFLLLLSVLWLNLSALFLFLYGMLKSRAWGIAGWLANALQKMSEELGKPKSMQVYFLALILTVLNWLILIGICWLVLRSLGVQVGYAETIIGSSVASMAQFIPLGSVGNIGPMEAGWTAGFAMVGVESKVALNSGVVLHLVMIFCSLVLAGLTWTGMWWRRCVSK